MSNIEKAYDFINSWPKWIKRTVNIYGPKGSGKTHLVSILKRKTSAIETESNKLSDKVFFKFNI